LAQYKDNIASKWGSLQKKRVAVHIAKLIKMMTINEVMMLLLQKLKWIVTKLKQKMGQYRILVC